MWTTPLLLVGLCASACCASPFKASTGKEISEGLAARSLPDSAFKTVYQFPDGHFAEKLAVRPDGSLLVTIIGAPEVWLVHPAKSEASVVYTFTGQGNSVLGITEYKPDVFAVAVGEFSVSEVSGKDGSWSIWSLDFSGGSVNATKITAIPAAKFLNGLTSLSSKGTVLAADSAQGVVYRIDTATGTWSVAIDSAALKPNASATYHLGVSGIHVHGPYLYFDNAGQSPLLGRFILSADGTSSESAEVIVEDPTFPVNDKYYGFDDFTFDGSGNVWLATNPSKQIVKISPEGVATVEAGSLGDSTLQGCTSLQFGRTASDQNVLYVNVNGAGGKLVAVNTSG
ncbi:hypothetical protein TI39_contig319g00025 [Zymoseptoria brevis]|uniref:SMP-30/Gluconolactonase/LRE-like region domain-containing protein n=1 Tax=Zymoseptoria brevis TaxID=1047168 RepID=A0A0F4GTW1_9PEZI|nr:hypothetical protein TI39_contig319g00025 [Zymoseptoria brevis]